ncbi:MAG: lipid-A-disaccharide synthase [Gemmatimonadales bacterium]|nr:MAG: lipid-A-disaccharide synthase [Gemmatimonadales bacterium]
MPSDAHLPPDPRGVCHLVPQHPVLREAPVGSGPVILLLAGEPSGDLHGARVARALRERWPEARLLGLGGERMEAEGVELLAGLEDLAVMGFVEVAARLPFFWRLERRVRRLLDEGHIDLVLPIDYPGFNLRITAAAHDRGIPVLFFIAPQVWAWKAHRAARLARTADRIAVILPFEEEIFLREGGKAVFVGHPLLDRPDHVEDREAFCRRWGFDPDRPILALFPGSRAQELSRLLAPFTGAARLLRAERPELQLGVARAQGARFPQEATEGCTVVDDGRALLRHARAALVKSGTSTLEAALEGVPFVVAYRTHPLTFRIAKRVVRVDHVALANLVAGHRAVPELLQDEVTPERLAREVAPLLDDPERRERMRRELAGIRNALGEPGAAGRVAELAAEILHERQATGTGAGAGRPGAS